MRFQLGLIGLVVLFTNFTHAARAVNFSLNPATYTVSPSYVGPIVLTGTIKNSTGRLDQIGVSFAFNSTHTAGINGAGFYVDPAFLAWNGIGTYTGAIFALQMNSTCLGYANGMPLGHYASNWAGGFSAISLTFRTASGLKETVIARYAIDVVPAPGACAAFGLVGLFGAGRRRRNAARQ
ncbi:MAG: hypothetical protein ACREJD_10315 [Phycisphaerales bacterium]